jgi:hypothetical protein
LKNLIKSIEFKKEVAVQTESNMQQIFLPVTAKLGYLACCAMTASMPEGFRALRRNARN